MGWFKDIPNFQGDDWRDFFILAARLTRLHLRSAVEGTNYYREVLEAIPPDFWDSFRFSMDKSRSNLHAMTRQALINMTSPLGIDAKNTSLDHLSEILLYGPRHGIVGRMESPHTQAMVIDGINQAVLGCSGTTENTALFRCLFDFALDLQFSMEQCSYPTERLLPGADMIEFFDRHLKDGQSAGICAYVSENPRPILLVIRQRLPSPDYNQFVNSLKIKGLLSANHVAEVQDLVLT